MSLVIDRNTKAIAQDAIYTLAACPIGKTMRYDPEMVGGVIPGKNGKSQNILPIRATVRPSATRFAPYPVSAAISAPKRSAPATVEQIFMAHKLRIARAVSAPSNAFGRLTPGKGEAQRGLIRVDVLKSQ